MLATQGFEYSEGNVYQGDDGNGKKVHITVIFISNRVFSSLKALNDVEITANYPVPKQPVTTISVFLSSSKRASYIFLREFQEKYLILKDYIKLEPIYHTIECEFCSPQNCILDFCSFDYEHWRFDSGSKIVQEQLHQYAIFKQRGPELLL